MVDLLPRRERLLLSKEKLFCELVWKEDIDSLKSFVVEPDPCKDSTSSSNGPSYGARETFFREAFELDLLELVPVEATEAPSRIFCRLSTVGREVSEYAKDTLSLSLSPDSGDPFKKC